MKVSYVYDEGAIVRLLERDRAWSAYALSDLEPPHREHTRFMGAWHGSNLVSIVLVYTPPSFTSVLLYGDDAGVGTILREASDLPRTTFVVVSEEHRAVVERYYHLDAYRMYRMTLRLNDVRTAPSVDAAIQRLTPADFASVEELYRNWESTFFHRALLEHGLYSGAFVDGRLVAIAGTHTRSHRFSLGTIGGVFTLPEYRGRGLAGAVTASVAHTLLDSGIELVVLNVRQDNAPALAAYGRIGFRVHLPYWEGHAAAGSGST